MQGKYKTFEGTEISIKNCVKAKVKDLVVEGKTYQNLYDMKNLTYNYYDTFTEDGYINININIPELSTGYKVCKSAVNNLIKANTVYTIIIDVRKNTYNKKFGINSDYGNEGYFSKDIAIQQNFTGRMVVTATSKETLPSSSGQKVFRTQITPDSLGELEFKLMLLEGNYNTSLPDSIDGIESVAEKEENVLSIKVNEENNYINLPIPLRSLPNGVADTIEGNKLVQRVGRVVLDGNEDWKLQSCNVKGNGILNIFFIIQDLIIKLKEKQFIICDKYIQQKTPIADTTNEGVLVNEEKRLYLRLFTSKATTVEKAKEYIKGNPFVVYYELAEPIIHDLRIPPIQTVKGTKIITTENNIKPNVRIKIKTK